MDHQAIDRIQSLVHAAMIGNPGTDVPTLLVPEGYTLKSLEQFQETFGRWFGPDLGSFVLLA